jgi:hypothetical protein
METKPKLLKWSLIIGIVVVLNLFLNYSISLFYKEPDYNAYFVQPQVVQTITTKEDCLKAGGQWNGNDPKVIDVYKNGAVPVASSYCNPNFTKQKEFDLAQKVYQRNVFITLVILGVVSLGIGAFVANGIIVLGFSWGGVLSLIIASMRYWSAADNFIKVLILAIALGALIWLAVRKFEK